MAEPTQAWEIRSPSIEVYMLGSIAWSDCALLQRHIVQQTALRDDGQMVLLLAEHPAVVTIGRNGSPRHVVAITNLLRRLELEVHWTNRGGGCLVHAPGQLAVYPIVPLRWHGLCVGQYLRQFRQGLCSALEELRVRLDLTSLHEGIYGRTGQLASIGVAVRDWVTYHGAFVNVNPPMGLMRLPLLDSPDAIQASCLVAELGRAARMTQVRATIVRRLAEAFGCDRYHLHTGLPRMAGVAGQVG